MTITAALASIRKGDWVTSRRLSVYPGIFLAVSLIATTLVLHLSKGVLDPSGNLLGGDFIPFWSASNLIWQGKPEAAYDPRQLGAIIQDLVDGEPPNYAWLYPPTALLVVMPLAALPYLPSLTTWLALTFCGYLSLLWSMVPSRRALVPILAFSPVFINLGHGQNAFLTTALLGWGLILLPRRPWLAGLLMGALIYKPHLGLLIPLALLASRNWSALAGASLAALGMIAASYLLFGEGVWIAYLDYSRLPRLALEEGVLPWPKMISAFAAARLLGASVPLAWALQGLVSLVAATLVWRVWRRSDQYWIKVAILPAAALLAPPLVWDYDALLLGISLAALVILGRRDGFLDWEISALVWVWLTPLFWRQLTMTSCIPLGLMTLMLLVWLVARRSAHDARATGSPPAAWLRAEGRSPGARLPGA